MDFDDLLDRFEAAWRRGTPPDIAAFMGAAGAAVADRVARQNLLTELVMIDMWYRWREAGASGRGGESHGPGEEETCASVQQTDSLPACPRLEDYLRRYPELGPLERVPPVIIGEEYRARQRWGDRPEHGQYLARFRPQAAELEHLLPAIDAELAADTARSQPAAVPPAKPVQSEEGSAASESRGPPAMIGKYHVVGVLEAGGQAQVYRAVHPTLARELVIKLAHQPSATAAAQANQLVAEGRLLAELEHPHLARVYDLDFFEGRPFLVMEYVRGRNLRHCARQHRYAPRQAAALVAKIARALAAAHARGIIHQDVKPGNIIIDESGEPRLIDFGLARLRPAWSEQCEEPEAISGTVQYMSPEQACGQTEKIDPRSDVFALGAVLYWLLTDQAPFADANVLASLERARECDFDAAALRRSGVPRRLEAICLRAMQAEPADRYPSADQMAAELEWFASAPRRWRRAMAAAAGLAVVLAAIAAAWALWGGRPDSEVSHGKGATSQGIDPSALAVKLLGRPLRHDFRLEFQVLGHPVGPGGQVVLAEGERAVFRVEAERDCYLGIWHLDTRGAVTQLFPNAHDYDHFVQAGRARTIPGEREYAIRVTASEGQEYLHVVASSEAWNPPLGQEQGPYVVFATPEELQRWREQFRGLVLDQGRSAAIAEQLIVLSVRPREP